MIKYTQEIEKFTSNFSSNENSSLILLYSKNLRIGETFSAIDSELFSKFLTSL